MLGIDYLFRLCNLERMQFKNKVDEFLAEDMKRFDLPFYLVKGPEFSIIFDDLKSFYGNNFSLKPVKARNPDDIESTSFRVKGFAFFIAFYSIFSRQLGENILVLTELYADSVMPDTIFKLPSSVSLAIAHAQQGGVDHICFPRDFRYLLVRDCNEMVIGFGDAAQYLRDFRVSYPEFLVS